MTPGRLSRRGEFTPVPSHGSTFVYMIPSQNVMPGRDFTPVRDFATVSCKPETTTRSGGKSVCR